MKILIVNSVDLRKNAVMDGMKVILERNINIIKKCFGEENIIIYNIVKIKSIKAKLKRFFYSILGYCDDLTPEEIEDLQMLIQSNEVEYIFLNYSRFGIIAKLFKNLNKSIITFFHNVEISGFNLHIRNFNFIKKFVYSFLKQSIYMADKYAVRYSKKIIMLNKRDSNELKEKYGRDADLIFPTTFDDKYNSETAIQYDILDRNNKLLFIGSDFYGNREGLFWFIDACLDYINAELIVVGTGMDKYAGKCQNKKVSFFGYVDDLAAYYYQSDVVVLPILSGSGMKTKTCEALMYGKTIFGTTEAFQGYDALDYIGKKWLCNSADEFIQNINSYLLQKESKINQYSRNVFLENYLTETYESKIYNLIKSCNAL